MSTPFCVSPPNLAHRTKKHRKTCSKHRSPPLTFLPAVTPPHLMYSSVGRTTPSAPTTAYRQQKHFPKQRPKAATYLCRFAAKARFDNRPHPEGVSKEGGPQPSLFGRSRMRQNAERLARLTPSPSAAPPVSSRTALPAPSNSWCWDRTHRSPTWTPPAG